MMTPEVCTHGPEHQTPQGCIVCAALLGSSNAMQRFIGCESLVVQYHDMLLETIISRLNEDAIERGRPKIRADEISLAVLTAAQAPAIHEGEPEEPSTTA